SVVPPKLHAVRATRMSLTQTAPLLITEVATFVCRKNSRRRRKALYLPTVSQQNDRFSVGKNPLIFTILHITSLL
ncbi:MAG: hypothetical protein RSC76_02640, partial [Oscillospiraceae bacterium]